MSLTVTIPGAVEAAVGSTAPATLVLQLGVPGPAGSPGAQGPAGPGVAAGGTTGQALVKASGTDYDTTWTTITADDKLPLAGGTMSSGASINWPSVGLGYNASLSPLHLNFNLNTPTIGNYVIQSNVGYANYAAGYTDYIDDGEGNPTASFERSATVGAGQIDIANNDIVGSLNKTISLNPTSGITLYNTDGNSNTSVYTSSNIVFSDGGSGHDSELAGWGLGVELSADHAQGTTVEYNGLNVYDSAGHMIVSPAGLTFPDTSVQSTAFLGYASPAFTGVPTAPSAALGDDSTQIATTAFVQDAIVAGSAHAETLVATVRNNTGSSLAAFTVVYISGAVGNKAAVAKAQANSEATSAGTFAVTETAIANNADGNVVSAGVLSGVDTSAYADGDKLYLSPTVAGAVTTTKPSAPNHLVYVGVVTRSHPTLGTVSVRIQNGFELEELHNVAIASVADKDSLFYESSTSLWKNYTPANARTNLGLGTASTLASSAVVQTANNLSDVTASTARTNLGLGTMATQSSATYATVASPSLTGTPLSTTASIDTNTTQIATTAFVRDCLSDCTWSVPPISTTTTATSGTGSSYVNIPPDTGYLTGPNVNLAGYCQKGMQMFARSNSTYGFNYTKEMRIACKMAINWTSTFTGITYTLIQRLGNTGTGALGVVGFGITINMATKVLSIVAHNGTTLTTKATSWVAPTSGICSIDFMVKSDGTGTVYAYADGVLIDSTSGMATTTTSANTSMFVAVEINSAGTTSTANATGYISNLRSFVAHG